MDEALFELLGHVVDAPKELLLEIYPRKKIYVWISPYYEGWRVRPLSALANRLVKMITRTNEGDLLLQGTNRIGEFYGEIRGKWQDDPTIAAEKLDAWGGGPLHIDWLTYVRWACVLNYQDAGWIG